MKNMKPRLQLLFVLLLMPAMAQAQSVGLSNIISTFRSVTNGWYSSIFTDALGLFGALFGIELTWLVVTWMIGGKDVHEIFTSFIKKLLTIGFFYTVLESASQWVPWILNGFKNVAVTAGGEPITTVSDIAMTGLRAFVICVNAGPMAAAHDSASVWADVWSGNLSGALTAVGKAASAELGTLTSIDFLIGAIVGLILLFAFIYVVLELVAVQLEGMIVFSVGVIMLGFGGARWTARFVESYMQYAVAVGVRLMVITLWASFIEWQVNPLIKTTLINGNASLHSYGVVLILALLVAWLTKKLPGFANSILSGQSTLSGDELYGAVKKGMIAAAAVATGGAALAAGAAGTMGAGAMGAAKGAAGSSGAGTLGASGAGGAAGSSEAGAMGSAGNVPAPAAPEPAKPSGVMPPDAGPAGGNSTGASPQASAPAQGSSGGPASGSAPTPPAASNAAASGASAPASSGGPASTAPTGSGSTLSQPAGPVSGPAPASSTPASGQTVDHRPAAPNSPPGGESPGNKPVPAPTLLDLAKGVTQQTHDALHSTHDAINPGKPSSSGVSAPGLGVKHLAD
ncbi:P-type conjugative transfer protein TrbL [Acidithiobacillus ferrivorans]|nr:P-type conjugative transfer protein TrbL [Acidithiobacillus ferrivorans]